MPLTEVIRATKEAVAADASQAQVTFRAEHKLVGCTEVSVRVGSGHKLTVDEPEALGGANVAANPIEYALTSLGSCQAITYQFWAAHLGIKLDKVEIDIEGDLDVRGFFGIDDRVRPGLSAARLRVRLSGPEQAIRYRELAEAVDAHCPVLDLFRNPVPVHCELLTTLEV
jgi:uncharacterized OsmC-like protein